MTDVETHPYNASEGVPPGTCLLIIGTAPPWRFAQGSPKPLADGDVDFFYGSKDNQLWSAILPALYGMQFRHASRDHARATMIDFLTSHRIWMADVLQKYRRKKPRSPKDIDLIPEEFTQFRPILEQCAKLDTIIFTGGLAEKWTARQMAAEKIASPVEFSLMANGKSIPRHRRIKIELGKSRRELDAHTLPSPSNANWMHYYDEDKIQFYGDVLLKRCPTLK